MNELKLNKSAPSGGAGLPLHLRFGKMYDNLVP